jgi:hypothetical protein
MTTPRPRATPAAVLLTLALACAAGAAEDAKKAGPRLAHMVFFTLTDQSPAARERFVASCHKYLKGHEGTVFYAVGTIAEDVVEPGVSVRDFDVALHLVFEDKAAEARYLKDPRHVKFVDENKARFQKVRVFDSYVPNP